MRRTRLAALAALALAVLVGCTDIPTSSAPERIQSVPADNGQDLPTASPGKGEQPRQIVRDFLSLNASADPTHAAARRFLTAQARASWQDGTVTVLDSGPNVGDFNSLTGEVNVFGAVVGRLDAAGVYTPSLRGSGDGGLPQKIVFKIKLVAGQFRIDQLPSGLILSQSDFQTYFKNHPLYFFDQAGRYLVPDLRATNLTGLALQNWLLRQLVAGPRQSLVPAVDAGTFPAPQSGSTRVRVDGGTPLRIDVPGALALSTQGRNRLGAQIAYTLDPTVFANTLMTITDANTPVPIQEIGGSQFVVSQFSAKEPEAPAGDVYYLNDAGRLTTASGTVVSGRIASGPELATVAVARRAPGNTLYVAGCVECGQTAGRRLYLGTAAGGLEPTQLTGLASRPAWAPELREVWVGAGNSLYRVGLDGVPHIVPVAGLTGEERITAVRLSPEGARIALVVQNGAGNKLEVGSVVRADGQVQVAGLTTISPANANLLDVGWIDPTRLFAVGYDQQQGPTLGGTSEIVEVNVDGSDWEANGIGNLPGGPNYVTVVTGHVAWVSASKYVWEQSGAQDGGGWQSPGPSGLTNGDAPVYLE